MRYQLQIRTPVGEITATCTERGISMVQFSDSELAGKLLERYRLRLQHDGEPRTHPLLLQLESELGEYFRGSRNVFSLPLDPEGTAFQHSVWSAIRDIACGATISYQKLAAALKNPLGVRAVARANGQNPVCLLIPCHRVIGSDGSLTGYSGGMERKSWLLRHEQRMTGAAMAGYQLSLEDLSG